MYANIDVQITAVGAGFTFPPSLSLRRVGRVPARQTWEGINPSATSTGLRPLQGAHDLAPFHQGLKINNVREKRKSIWRGGDKTGPNLSQSQSMSNLFQ